MRFHGTVLVALLVACVFGARCGHAMVHGPADTEEANRVIERATADREFAIKKAQEREAMKVKNQEQTQQRFEELYKPSAANAKLPSPGVVKAGEEAEATVDVSGTNSILVLWGLVFLAMFGGGFYLYYHTRNDKRLREEKKQKAASGRSFVGRKA